ncbi:MAG TPA: hypothetical protein VFG10_04090 [Saprospiraceae bacterium]|nr:hypothetical protein [Saprospiraceae bacterium]
MKKPLLSRILTSLFLGCISTLALNAQYTPHFPAEWIDTSIVNARGLQEKVRMLKEDCNWTEKHGGKIDIFWLQTDQGNFFGYVYEYIMDCDNVRLIYWYHDASGMGQVVDFMIEDLEDESNFVVAKKKHLKNRKAYQKYLVPKTE